MWLYNMQLTCCQYSRGTMGEMYILNERDFDPEGVLADADRRADALRHILSRMSVRAAAALWPYRFYGSRLYSVVILTSSGRETVTVAMKSCATSKVAFT